LEPAPTRRGDRIKKEALQMNMKNDGHRDKRYAAFLLLAGILLSVFFIAAGRVAISRFFMPTASPAATGLVPEFPGFPIDINTASREDMMMLPGVGVKTAERIIEKRAELGGFKSIDDLLEVEHFGGAKLGAVRALVTVKRLAGR